MRLRLAWWLLAALLTGAAGASAQRQAVPADGTSPLPPHRTRLILKDGSYQLVMRYKVLRDRVQFVSAERGGETEEIPLALVDLDATRKWEKEHIQAISGDPADRMTEPAGPPVLDPELAREEADRAAIAPEVAADLKLDPQDTLLALDTFRGAPELVPMNQQQTELNKQTGHGILKTVINPRAVSRQLIVLKGEKADVQLHVSDPVLYLRLDDAQLAGGEALTVNTHGAPAAQDAPKKKQPGEYVIVRVDVRQDGRVVTSFETSLLGSTRRQEEVYETDVASLPGGHWARIVSRQPLLIGEYCLVEVLGEKEINLGVWDFGVHPNAPENRDVLKPEKKRSPALGRRGPS